MPRVIKTASQDLYNIASKELKQLTAKEAAATAARNAAQKAGKNVSQQNVDLLKLKVQIGKQQIIKDTYAKAIEKEQKELLDNTIRDSKLSKTAAKENATADSKSWLKENPKKVVAGVAAATLTALSLAKYIKSSETDRTITKVEASSDDIKITYTPSIEILESDLIDISGSKTDPSIDGNGISIVSSISSSQIKITPNSAVTTFTPGGKIIVHTSFGAQLGATVRDTIKSGGDAAGNFLSSLIPGLSGISNAIMIIICVVLLCACLASSGAAVYFLR